MYGWHVPPVYDAGLARPVVHACEHASFLLVGLLVWTVVLDRRRSPGRRAALAGAVLLCGMPLAEILLSTAPIYARYPSESDQLHAGLVMMAEQVATLGIAALLLFRSHAERLADQPAARRANA
jgi:putative membrane protein